MSNPQVSNETAVIEVAKLIMADDNSNPDIGWGKSWRQCVDEAISRLGVDSNYVNLIEVLAELE